MRDPRSSVIQKRRRQTRQGSFKKGVWARGEHYSKISDQSILYTDEKEIPQPHDQLSRVELEVFQAAVDINNSILPTKLRPLPPPPKNETEINQHTEHLENAIISLSHLTYIINSVNKFHCKYSKKCPCDIYITNIIRKGLCISVQFTCKLCNLEFNPYKLSDDVAESHSKPGPPRSSLNMSSVIPITKTKMGISDVRFLLSALNIRLPTKSCREVESSK
jgi:hypothetical protein